MKRLAAAGALAGLFAGLVEGLWVAHAAAGYFDGRGEWVQLVVSAMTLAALWGLAAGVAAGLVTALVGQTRWVPWSAALLTAPYAGWAALAMWSGGKARTVAGRPLWVVLSALLLCAAVAFLVGAARSWSARATTWSPARRRLFVAALLVGCVAVYEANQNVLPRLYLFLHVTLALAEAGLALFAVSLLRPPRVVAPAALVLAVGGAAASLVTLGRAPVVRTLLIERTVLVGGLAKRSPPPKRHGAPPGTRPTVATASLPAAPHLDGDLVIITIDAMRADRLTPAIAPHLSALAQSGVRVERAYAQVPHTSFSLATLLTGKYVYSLSTQGATVDADDTLAQLLRRERFKTAAFFPPAVFFIDRDRLADFERTYYGFEYVKYEFLPAPQRTDQVIHFLESEKPKRAFLWVHYLEPHEPYDVHPGGPPAGASDRERYDGEVRFVDGEVGRLLDYLRAHRPGALVIVAADHGEEMGEHGGRYHGTTVYEEQTRVPLVLAVLGADAARWPQRVVAGPVGLVDVLPTVLNLFGITPSVKVQGHSFAPWLNPAVETHAPLPPAFAEIGTKKMVTDGHDKLVCDVDADSCALYDLSVDPGEKHNLAGDAAPRAEALRAALDDWMARQSRFEASSADVELTSSGDGELKRALERGRRGERAALPGLARLLTHKSAVVRREAARLVDTLPPDPSTSAALRTAAQDSDAEVAREATFALCRIDAATCARARTLAHAACASGPADSCGRGALALHDVTLDAQALDQLHDALDLELRLVDDLATSGQGDAFAPLLVALADVRLRLHTVGALVRLGDPRTVDILARWLAHEPYVPVRAAMATALGQLAARQPGQRATARAALEALEKTEQEAPVLSALAAALADADSPLVAPGRSLDGDGDVWLVGRGAVLEGQTLHAQSGATTVESDALEPHGARFSAHVTLPRRARWTFSGAVVDGYVRPSARTHSK